MITVGIFLIIYKFSANKASYVNYEKTHNCNCESTYIQLHCISVLALGLGASYDTQPSFQAVAYSSKESGLQEKYWEPNYSV